MNVVVAGRVCTSSDVVVEPPEVVDCVDGAVWLDIVDWVA
jgi:hypothetical protein